MSQRNNMKTDLLSKCCATDLIERKKKKQMIFHSRNSDNALAIIQMMQSKNINLQEQQGSEWLRKD